MRDLRYWRIIILYCNPKEKSKYGISMNEAGLYGLYELYDMGEAIVHERLLMV